MRTITQNLDRLILILVFLSFSATSFSQNAILVVSGNGNAIANGDVSPITTDNTDYGAVTIGSTQDNTFVLTNNGTSNTNSRRINFSVNPPVTISGPDAGQFSITVGPALNSTINGGGNSINLTIRFTPTLAAGVKNATVTISYKNGTNVGTSNYTFAIRGTSTLSPEINIQGNSSNITDGSPTPALANWTDFGSTNVGTGITRTFTIQNLGTGNLTIGTITFTGANPTNFAVTTAPVSPVVPGGSTTFIVTFTPSTTGIRTANISIVDNDSDENPYNFAIQGTGISPEINVQGNSVNIVDGDSTPSATDWTIFGSTPITVGITRTFMIQNTGTANLTINSVIIFGTNAADFTITTPPTTPIAPGGSSAFIVTFNPTGTGTRNASVIINNNDSDETVYDFAVQGTGNPQVFFDSDGDGVYDNIDIDDDNDGIKDSVEETNCISSNGPKVNYKFLNETFGTGARTTINTTYNATTTYTYESGPGDLDDGEYTVGSSAQIATWAAQYWYTGGDHTGNANGRMAMFNASYTPGIFYTAAITGALPNIPITYSFWVINLDRTDAPLIATRIRPNVKVEIRDLSNTLLATINTGDIAPTVAGNAAGNWYQFTANLTLSVSSFNVIFINNNTGGLGNDLALDDIQISQSLCDIDSDGVADMFDLDADNDGIPDVVEVGLGNLSNGKGKIDVAWIDANGNGLYDGAEALSILPDNDGDGIPNYIDLDSDNDSVFDVDESGTGNTNATVGYINGDGDITGDGVGDGLDSETFRNKDTNGDGILEGFGDGILDLYDYGVGIYGNLNQGTASAPFLNYVLDSDGDGIPNYLDVKSDGVNFDISKTLYASLDANNDGIIDGITDVDKDGIRDAFDTNTVLFGSPRDLNRKLLLDFDGRNDYGQSAAVLGGLSKASLMAWIDLNSAFSTDGVIIGQDKFQIRITSAKKLEAVVNGTVLTYNLILNTSQWYHVAATYSGGVALKLYLNGAMVTSQVLAGAISADISLLTIGRNPIASNKFFKGKIDEVRVFNTALTDTQVQRMVYQEIQNTGAQVRGIIIPKDIGALPFANLLRYYRMDVYKDDIIDDLTTPAFDTGTGMEIYNYKNIYTQQAPMPFLTERKGNFVVAVNSPTNEIRGLDIVDYDWSIVDVKHDVTETSNSVDLGMIVDSGKNVIMNNDTKLQNDWYLKLDGKIDLQGRSQLVQTSQSDLDPTSAGSLERDQQGTKNIYNYNYWSSPVGPINALTNNNNCTVSGILKDGTNSATPININWVSGYDGSPGTPINLARYWIFKFQNSSPAYANWTQILETGSLSPGQGYTLKGSGAASADQNYTFLGKPFNGSITIPIAANNLNLCGNPYASAIDANAFINDNSASLKGTLYFWEHYTTNNSHNLAEYQGGYATRNLTGGTVPVSPALISGLGSSTRIPGRFIPVGQGFFVAANATGGNIVFNNSQRLFIKEDNVSSNVMFKNADITNAEDPYEEDHYAKIRLGYTNQDNFHRQTLLGFMDEKATSGLDYGYDALLLDEQANDMCFLLGTNKLIILGDGYFNEDNAYPIMTKADVAGTVKFMIDGLENFDSEKAIYIYDADTNTYHDIRTQMFEVEIPAGENHDRFSLQFKDKALSTNQNVVNEIKITHIQNGNTLVINNDLLDVSVKKVILFNIIGQPVRNWKVSSENQKNILIPIQNVSAGIYIAKVETNKGSFNKKIIIK